MSPLPLEDELNTPLVKGDDNCWQITESLGKYGIVDKTIGISTPYYDPERYRSFFEGSGPNEETRAPWPQENSHPLGRAYFSPFNPFVIIVAGKARYCEEGINNVMLSRYLHG